MSKFKKGEIVRCKPGFNKIQGDVNYGGAGYKEGVPLTIKHMNTYGDTAYFFENHEDGVYESALVSVAKNRKDKLDKLLK